MSTRSRRGDYDRARKLARQGEIDSAMRIFMGHGDYLEAARALAMASRFLEAGELIMGSLDAPIAQLEFLAAGRKKDVHVAANYLIKGGDAVRAARLLEAIGRRERAAEVLERAGDMMGAEKLRRSGAAGRRMEASSSGRVGLSAKVTAESARRLEQEGNLELAARAYLRLRKPGDAGRVLRQAGRLPEAGKVYEEAGLHYEATVCYMEAKDAEGGVRCVTWVPRDHPRYRAAAGYAVRMASYLDQMSFKLESFLAPYLESAPRDKAELEVFYRLARLYERHNLVENAKEALRRLLERAPGYRDAGERLSSLDEQTRLRPEQVEQIRKEEESFLSGQAPASRPPPVGALPELPPLPDLDSERSGQARAGQHTNRGMGGPVSESNPTRLAKRDPTGSAPVSAAAPEAEQGGEVADDFKVGGIIADRYRLVAKIGQGGMAMVYRATDLDLEEEIALKVFFLHIPDPEVQAECIARFKLELKLNRQITHDNVLKLYDIGLHLGHRYISMELLVGHPLNELLDGPMDVGRGLTYLIQACDGLQSAHKRGVVHRDIKPENLFITDEEEVKVMDFGIAKNTLAKGLTVAGRTAGTPHYMAPEQIQDFSSVRPTADIYSLGITAYEMFTGKLPFDHEELRAVYQMQLMSTPVPPRKLVPEIPEGLEKVILRMLNKSPEGRFSSCKTLSAELERLRLTCLGGGQPGVWG